MCFFKFWSYLNIDSMRYSIGKKKFVNILWHCTPYTFHKILWLQILLLPQIDLSLLLQLDGSGHYVFANLRLTRGWIAFFKLLFLAENNKKVVTFFDVTYNHKNTYYIPIKNLFCTTLTFCTEWRDIKR